MTQQAFPKRVNWRRVSKRGSKKSATSNHPKSERDKDTTVMVSGRRAPTKTITDEIKVKSKGKRRKSSLPSEGESPSKRRKRNHDPFSFDSDDEIQVVTSQSNRTPKGKSRKMKVTGDETNGTPTKTPTKADKKGRREVSMSPSPDAMDISEMSDDELISAPVTPSRKPRKTPTKTKSTSKISLKMIDTTPPSPMRTKFQEKLKAVAASSPVTAKTTPSVVGSASKRKRSESKVVAESTTINGTLQPSKSKKEITADQLQRIKIQVLPKLCGRAPIPLQNHSFTVAEYVPPHHSFPLPVSRSPFPTCSSTNASLIVAKFTM